MGANLQKQLFALEAAFHDMGFDTREKQVAFIRGLPVEGMDINLRRLLHLYCLQETMNKIGRALGKAIEQIPDEALKETLSAALRRIRPDGPSLVQ